MQLHHHYYYFKSALDPETCQKIVNLGLKKLDETKKAGLNTEGVTFGNNEKGSMPDSYPQGDATKQQLKNKGIDKTYVRDSEVAWLTDTWLYDEVIPFVDQANFKAGWKWDIDYSENFQFTVYNPGGFYGWHKDGPSDHRGKYRRYLHGITQESIRSDGRLPDMYSVDEKMIGKVRKISVTVNLNSPDDYEGGNLMFDFGHHTDGERFHECEEIRPQGSIIVFPSFVDHCVTPITKGTRYSLVLWCLGDPFR